MFKPLARLPNCDVVIPWSSPIKISFKYQRILIGKSPDDTEHWMLVESPEFDGSSPNVKGRIFGGAEEVVSISEKKINIFIKF